MSAIHNQYDLSKKEAEKFVSNHLEEMKANKGKIDKEKYLYAVLDDTLKREGIKDKSKARKYIKSKSYLYDEDEEKKLLDYIEKMEW